MSEEAKIDSGQFSQLLLAIGQLQGAMQASRDELSRMHAESIRLATDVEHKHAENQKSIETLRKDQQEMLDTHSEDDDTRFRKVDRLIWMGVGALGLLQFVGWLLVFLKN